jgi:multidrug efflux pump subunit AcrA (membrane-fusion protein)
MKLNIEKNQIRVDQAKSKLDKLTLISDIEGIVLYDKLWTSGKKVREGDVVWANMPIIQIPDLSAMQVKLEVCEAVYKRIANDQHMEVVVDAFPDIRLTGKVKNKAPVGRPVKEKSEVKVFDVVASLDSLSLNIQPGLGVTCDILVKSVPDTIVIPLISLFDEDSLKVVYIAENERFTRRVVSVSEHNNKEAIIGSGIDGNEILALMKPPNSLINP